MRSISGAGSGSSGRAAIVDLARDGSPGWVTVHDPRRASPPERGALEGYAYWEVPEITAPGARWVELPDDPLTAEELEARQEHLRALGYVN